MSSNLQRLTSLLTRLSGRDASRSRQELEELMADTLPTLSLAGPIANALLCHHLAGREQAVLLDIGLGTGRQAVDLVRCLGARADRPRSLTVVAVEPDGVSLRAAEHNLMEASQAYGLDVHVMPFQSPVEELDPSFWALVASLQGTLLVHSAFTLHRVRGSVAGEERKDGVLRRLRMLEPQALVLVEPSSDHQVSDLELRFHNGWRFYGQTFHLVDQLPLAPLEREALKAFLARELEGLLADSGERCARGYEHVSGWWRRLARTGFTRAAVPQAVDLGDHPLVHPNRYPGYVGLDYRAETLVAVLCATLGARGR
ncbi:GAI protein2C [Pyxidicoccus fallax]|uniref:GRAS family protein n=2 Tax=Pyxidicoccus fallax TaxID=394095 RepID=A0A848LYK6_9BACT|nr:GRAS family protein [Pyxidicoccus fallax]NMO22711.1 GRAS family protein [Pyxidicoccus fallax]NPC84839.1 GAI protein2C [Pyxidicoccus fallax]